MFLPPERRLTELTFNSLYRDSVDDWYDMLAIEIDFQFSLSRFPYRMACPA